MSEASSRTAVARALYPMAFAPMSVHVSFHSRARDQSRAIDMARTVIASLEIVNRAIAQNRDPGPALGMLSGLLANYPHLITGTHHDAA